MALTALHARALRSVKRYGTSVTFTGEASVSHDAATETFGVPVPSTVSGTAVGVPGEDTKMFFVPTTYGAALPKKDYKVTWRGAVRRVEDVQPVEPEGVFLAATVVLA